MSPLAFGLWSRSVGLRFIVREADGYQSSPIHYQVRRKLVEAVEDGVFSGKGKSLPQKTLRKFLQWEYVLGYRFHALRVVNEKTILGW
jgi:hypothetical protein